MRVLKKLYFDQLQIIKLKLGADKLGINFIIRIEKQQSGYLPHLAFRVMHQRNGEQKMSSITVCLKEKSETRTWRISALLKDFEKLLIHQLFRRDDDLQQLKITLQNCQW